MSQIRLFSFKSCRYSAARFGQPVQIRVTRKGTFMRRATAWIVVVGVLGAAVGTPARVSADDGFWVTLAAGVSGSATPSDYTEFWFESPHAPSISVNQYNGPGTVQALTGGGSTFFGGAGVPV